jgi:hypothetical protein
MGYMRMRSKFWSEELKGRNPLDELGVGRKILEWFLGNRVGILD